MKKSLKILTLVLSLALICGALVVAAFATDDAEMAGVTTLMHWDFENMPEGSLNSTLAGKYNTSNQAPLKDLGMTPVQGPGNPVYDGNARQGEGAIASQVTPTGKANQYFQWTADENNYNVGGMNGYIVGGCSAEVAWSNNNNYLNFKDPETGLITGENTQPYKLKDYDFVAEADIWMPEGYHYSASPSMIKFHIYGIGHLTTTDKDGNVVIDPATRVNWVGEMNAQIYFKTDETGSYIYIPAGKQTRYYVDENSWAHVTFAYETEIVKGANYDYLVSYVTLWVNGEYVDKVQYGSSESANIGGAAAYIPDHVECFYVGDIRVQVTGSNAAVGEGIAADNMIVRSISKTEYTGNLYDVIENKKNITEWDANIYNRANMPYGKTVVKNLDTEVEYDNLQYAIDMAEAGEHLALCNDVNVDVIVNNEIEIDTAGYNHGEILAGKGYSIYDEDGVYWTEEGGSVEISWGDCVCGLDACDETHPGGVVTEVGIGGNIFSSYVTSGKSMDWTCSEGLTNYKLIGWEDADGNQYTAESVMTAELADECGYYLELTPVIEESTPTYQYTKSGETVYAFAESTTLEQAVEAADADTTFYLLGDVSYNNTSSLIDIKKNLTVDLNGYSIVAIQNKDTDKPYGLFAACSNIEFTLTTSVNGGRIFFAKDMGAEDAANSFQGSAIVRAWGPGSVVTFDGSKGLEIYSSQLYMADSGTAGTLIVNGGTYVEPVNAQDSWGYIQLHDFVRAEFKDATFIRKNGRNCGMLALMGNGPAPADTVEVTIDNCAFIGSATVCEFGFPELKVTITNSYIGGNINPTRGASRSGGRDTTDLDKGTWILGEGNYIANTATIGDKVKVAEGYEIVDPSISKTYNYMVNNFYTGNVEASLKLEPDTITTTYNRVVVKIVAPITVNWVDAEGNSLGTTEAKPGYVATSPAVSVADGWVNASYTADIPADATDGYTVTVDENTKVVYTAGKIPMYWNYTIVLHFEVNIYYPTNAPEGVTNVKPLNNGAVPSRLATGEDIIDGVTMNRFNNYPGVANADNDMTLGLTFEYGGQTIIYNAPGVNIGDYAKAIFNGEYSKEMNEAVLAVLNYVDAGNAAKNQTTGTEVTEAIALAAEKGITIENVTIDTERTGNYEALSEYVSGVQIAIGSQGGVQFQFIAKDPTNAAGLRISYLWESGKQHVNQNWFNNGYWYCHNTWAYCFDDECTIQLTDAEGNVVAECEYSVWDYAAATWNELDDVQKNLIVATLTWAQYAEAVRV